MLNFNEFKSLRVSFLFALTKTYHKWKKTFIIH